MHNSCNNIYKDCRQNLFKKFKLWWELDNINEINNYFKIESELYLVKVNLKTGEEEIQDLIKYWDDLIYWERDNSMNSALKNAKLNLNIKMTPELEKRNKKLLDEIQRLDKLNSTCRPTKLEKFIGKVLNVRNEPYRPRARICVNLLLSLPNLSQEDLSNLDYYLGITDDVVKNGRSFKLYNDVLCNRTLALFYAFRNYLVKLHT